MIVVLVVSASAIVLALGAAVFFGFMRGFQQARALHEGTSDWATYESEKYGFEARLPANFVAQPDTLPGDNTPATRIRARHATGPYADITLAHSPDAAQWPSRMLRHMPVEAVVRHPASGLIVDTAPQPQSEFLEWKCAMSWGSNFCFVSIHGKDREAVDSIAEQVFASLRFHEPSG